MSLLRLVYFSENRIGLRRRLASINELQSCAVRRNKQVGITGMLVYDDDWFVQALEGEAAVVDTTFARIERDPRHANAKVMARQDIRDRKFGAWDMGFAERTPENARFFGSHWLCTGLNAQHMTEAEMLGLLVRVSTEVLLPSMATLPDPSSRPTGSAYGVAG